MTLPAEIVVVRDGTPMVSTLQIAELYEKEHKNVLSAIKNLQVSDSFRELNFKLSDYSVDGQVRRYPMFWVTRDGFWRLSMAFSQTPKAADVCEGIIEALNWAEKQILKGKGSVLITDMDAEQLFQLAAERARKERIERDQAIANEKATIEETRKLITQERGHQERTNQQWRDELTKLGKKALYLANNLAKSAQQEQFDLTVIQGGKKLGNVCEWFGEEMTPSTKPGFTLSRDKTYMQYLAWCESKNRKHVNLNEFIATLVRELGVGFNSTSGVFIGIAPKSDNSKTG